MMWMWICLMSKMNHVLSLSYSNHFTCKIPGGLDHAKTVSSDTGCELLYQVIPGGIKTLKKTKLSFWLQTIWFDTRPFLALFVKWFLPFEKLKHFQRFCFFGRWRFLQFPMSSRQQKVSWTSCWCPSKPGWTWTCSPCGAAESPQQKKKTMDGLRKSTGWWFVSSATTMEDAPTTDASNWSKHPFW